MHQNDHDWLLRQPHDVIPVGGAGALLSAKVLAPLMLTVFFDSFSFAFFPPYLFGIASLLRTCAHGIFASKVMCLEGKVVVIVSQLRNNVKKLSLTCEDTVRPCVAKGGRRTSLCRDSVIGPYTVYMDDSVVEHIVRLL